MAQDHYLRTPCQGIHPTPSGCLGKAAWYVRRDGVKAAIQHLSRLGITAVELLPAHHFLKDRHLVNGLTNWGYNTLAYFAPEPLRRAASATRCCPTVQNDGCRSPAAIEVILDVVYNHTAEGSHLGPTLSLRGIDNAAYYKLSPEDPRYYMDYTGCGNSLNMRHPRVLQLIMDSLRYWATEMHVDGFRFDLASTLARELYEVDQLGAFFDIIHQDPVLSQLKLIAEPWDLGIGGIRWAIFQYSGVNGTANTVMLSAASGKAMAISCQNLPRV